MGRWHLSEGQKVMGRAEQWWKINCNSTDESKRIKPLLSLMVKVWMWLRGCARGRVYVLFASPSQTTWIQDD
jgi:hypothetical protein